MTGTDGEGEGKEDGERCHEEEWRENGVRGRRRESDGVIMRKMDWRSKRGGSGCLEEGIINESEEEEE
ncbi:hypothetical protein Pmani_015431 [Petrolisthes manimaculis]|uniref:Uncharacterized protein n=1 Tax=Petrolisthes manimaculis TaxID=1843537 RepID=A0AAE1PQX8_9EUCA|nr:hypothetical protein Pmani_015431 [Petrolisthes manimaculis]